ncbi:MAG TPA: hypothetical protein VED22_08070 [Nitrososphaerales archaeon]|nr:hypothetical protein [Nitrososphaerales archaeon]
MRYRTRENWSASNVLCGDSISASLDWRSNEPISPFEGAQGVSLEMKLGTEPVYGLVAFVLLLLQEYRWVKPGGFISPIDY